ncbi:hypothetical protein AKO1_006120 [Acrasis kona]|uniref:Uncharacterized protein n=1 Tax=Acrasis kona TaxID=1008807 RepID=A0AAW2YGQ3_9EUKA
MTYQNTSEIQEVLHSGLYHDDNFEKEVDKAFLFFILGLFVSPIFHIISAFLFSSSTNKKTRFWTVLSTLLCIIQISLGTIISIHVIAFFLFDWDYQILLVLTMFIVVLTIITLCICICNAAADWEVENK